MATDIVNREEIHMLIVDADPVSCKLLEKTLQSCKYKVTVTEDFYEALSILKDENNNFHIALVDVHQHEAEGFDVIEMAAQMKIFTIQFSKVDENVHALVKDGIACGTDLFMPKPIDFDTANCLWQHLYSKKIHQRLLKDEYKKYDDSREATENGSSPKESCDEKEMLIKDEGDHGIMELDTDEDLSK